jgi:hypothetical protein
MIEVTYQREIPYPQAVVLSQYFDLEHVEYVHPKSFGRARMVATHGRVIVWDLEWPPIGRYFRLQSRFEQEYVPPWGVHVRIVSGALCGTESTTQLLRSALGTIVQEHYRIAIANVPGFRTLVQRALVRRLHRIWEEDLAVKVCRGGWPGVPCTEASRQEMIPDDS